ncbi:MAG: hypothetical protein ABI551_20150, partial [Polyangiaceae bacterium]
MHLPTKAESAFVFRCRQFGTIPFARAIIETDGARMSGEWRWADPRGQQRLVRQDELCAALSDGAIPSN